MGNQDDSYEPETVVFILRMNLNDSARYWLASLPRGVSVTSRSYIKSSATTSYNKGDSRSKPMPYLRAKSEKGSRINPIFIDLTR